MITTAGDGHPLAFSRSPRAVTCSQAITAAAAACALGALLISAIDALRDKPLPDVGILLVVAVPTVAIGQIWMIALIGNRRMGQRTGGWRSRRPSASVSYDPRKFLFGDLPLRAGTAFLVLFLAGFLSAMSAFAASGGSEPVGSSAGCPYRLNNGGTVTCVSRDTYDHVRASIQRFPAGILLGFFSLDAGVALGGLLYRRSPS